MKKADFEKLSGLVDQLFEIVGGPSIADRLEQTDRIEEAVHQAIDEATPDDGVPGTVIVALCNVLAQHIVLRSIKEPPEVPAAMVSITSVQEGMKTAVEALTHFAGHAVREAEAGGATVVLRFRRPPKAAPAEATETAPSTAPGASGPLRDAEGATEGAPPAYDRDRDNPLTDETTFGGKASGTEG